MASSSFLDRNSGADLLNEHEAAEFFGGRIPVRTFQYWRAQGRGPAWHRLGRHVLYKIADLQAFVDNNRVDTADR
jgi:hypothetical protein